MVSTSEQLNRLHLKKKNRTAESLIQQNKIQQNDWLAVCDVTTNEARLSEKTKNCNIILLKIWNLYKSFSMDFVRFIFSQPLKSNKVEVFIIEYHRNISWEKIFCYLNEPNQLFQKSFDCFSNIGYFPLSIRDFIKFSKLERKIKF